MGIRRQIIEFDYGDDGFQSIENLESFPEKQQSIISSGFGNATEPSAATKVNQFITVEAMGSTLNFIGYGNRLVSERIYASSDRKHFLLQSS